MTLKTVKIHFEPEYIKVSLDMKNGHKQRKRKIFFLFLIQNIYNDSFCAFIKLLFQLISLETSFRT